MSAWGDGWTSRRARTRAGRDGTAELFDACPSEPALRTFGVLGSAWVPLSLLAVFAFAYLAGIALAHPEADGVVGSTIVATLLGVLMLGAGGYGALFALGLGTRGVGRALLGGHLANLERALLDLLLHVRELLLALRGVTFLLRRHVLGLPIAGVVLPGWGLYPIPMLSNPGQAFSQILPGAEG